MATISSLRRSTWSLSNNLHAIAEPTLGLSSYTHTPLKTESLRAVTTRAATWIHQQYNYTRPPPRQYSTTVVDLAHRGLTLPYPSDAPVDTNLFEDESKHAEYDLVTTLPSLVHKQKYSAAAKTRLRLAEQNIPIPKDMVYRKMAMRMLDTTSNPYGKVRFNSFLVWWAMTPDLSAIPEHALEAAVASVDRVILSLMESSDDLQPLMRFALLVSRKGFADLVITRSVPHIVRWSLPAVSAKFLKDLSKAVSSFEHAPRLRRSTYEHAIWGHIWAKRFEEASLLFKEYSHKMAFRDRFCMKVLECFNRLEQKEWFDLWSVSIRAAYPKLKLPKWRKPPADTVAEKPWSLVDTLKLFRRNITKRRPPPSRDLAAFMHEYLATRPNGRALHSLHHRLAKRHQAYKRSQVRRKGALGTQQGYWAAAEMIYHMRHHHDPISALRVFDAYYLSNYFIPPNLQNVLSSTIHPHSPPTYLGLGGQTLDNDVQSKLWPSSMIIPLFWEAIIASRRKLGLSLEGAYQYFTQSLQHPLRDLDSDEMTHQSPTIHQLRRMHNKNPYHLTPAESRPRYNIHTPTRAPIYRPDHSLFNTFLTATMRDTSMTPDDRHAMAFRIFEDMTAWDITPSTTSWSLLANVASRAGQWHQVLRLLEKLRAGGLMGQGWKASRTRRRHPPAPAHNDNALHLSDEIVRNGVGSPLEVVYGGIIRGLTESRMLEEAKMVENLLASDGYVPGSNKILDEVLDVLRSREGQKRTMQYRQ